MAVKKKAKSSVKKGGSIRSTLTKTAVSGAISAASGLMGLKAKKGGGGGKRRKKSALWYAKEIQRMRLKKRYEKIKLGMVK